MNLTTLFIVLLPSVIYCASEVANYPVITTIKSGEHKLFLQTSAGPTSKDFQQSFFVTYSSPPYVGIGLLVFQAQPSGSQIGFTVTANSISTTSFISSIIVNNGTTFNQLRYMYLSIDKSQNFGVIYFVEYQNLSQFTGTINTVVEFVQNYNATYNLDNVNLFVPILNAFIMDAANNQFSLKVDAFPSTASEFKVVVSSNSTLTYVSLYVIWVDQTALEESHTRYFDVGFTLGANSQAVDSQLDIPTSSFNYFNFITGANWFNFGINQILSFNFNGGPVSTISSYNYVRANIFHWLQRDCRTFTYYLHVQAKCYDICPSRFAENTTFQFCQKCDYSCLQCLSDGLSCTQCDNSTNRFLQNNSSCTCFDGFFNEGVSVCGTCDYTCQTCQTEPNKCLSCDRTRQLINDTCPCQQDKFDTNNSSAICEPCDYTCNTCQSQSNFCTSCNSSASRDLINGKCLCRSGFSQDGVEQCLQDPTVVCISTCQTCKNTSSTCTSCAEGNNRQLIENSCLCISGFESVQNNLKCSQICGDGKVFEDQCDDGNNENGDGCSSICQFEDSYDCDNTTQPTLCVFQQGYTISFISLEKYQYENKINIFFTIVPAPPSTSIATITGISNFTLTFELLGQSLAIVIEYFESIEEETQGRLSMTNVGTTNTFSFDSSNKMALNSYSDGNYELYKVQIILVYVLIGMVWISSIIFTVLQKQTISWSVSLIFSIGMIWIGVQGFQKLLLYYHPLTYLQYLFGYNHIIEGQDGLFAYVNFTFLLNVLPIFIAVIALILNKISKNRLLNQQTKRFFLFDLSYALFCINTVMVIYGLYTENFSQTYDALSIASLCFGIAYLLILLISSITFVVRQESLKTFKIQISKPLLHMVFLWLKIAALFSYLFILQYFTLSPIIVLSSSLLIIICIFIFKPYSNSLIFLINQVTIFLSFLAYTLIIEVEAAEWSGFAILIILYIQVFFNILFAAKYILNNKSIQGQNDEDDEDYEMQIYGKQRSDDASVKDEFGTVMKPVFQNNIDQPTQKPFRQVKEALIQ